MKVLVCGGGNICHAVAGMLSHYGHIVRVLTRNPTKWSNKLTVNYLGEVYCVLLDSVSSEPSDLLVDIDVVVITCPLSAVNPITALLEASGLLFPTIPIIGIPGRLYLPQIQDFKAKHNPLLLVSRTPYICRAKKYGSNVEITGICHGKIKFACLNGAEEGLIYMLFRLPCEEPVNNVKSIDLNNSNSLLHTCRLYDLFCTGITHKKQVLFYTEWTDLASQLLIQCDNELQNIINSLNKDESIESQIYINPVLSHYQCQDAYSLTKKMCSIPAFTTITSPMYENTEDRVFLPDVTSRYFLEDVNYGLKYILQEAKSNNVQTPTINMVYNALLNLIQN